MADPQNDGWEDITDPSDVPGDIRKSLGVAGVRKALGVGGGASDSAAGAGKPLPAWAANPYEKQIATYSGLAGSLSSFKDEFGGNTLTGNAENTLQGLYSGLGSPGQRDWWAQFRANDNVIRNSLFGAALTPGEQKAYEATTVAPSMDPKEIKRNLQSRRDIIQKALGRKTNFLRKQGYSGDAIDALAGEYAPDFNPNLREQAKGGDQTSGAAGAAADGSGTPPTSPNATPPAGDDRGDATFNDEGPQLAAGVERLSPEAQDNLHQFLLTKPSAQAIKTLYDTLGAGTLPTENAQSIADYYAKGGTARIGVDYSKAEVTPVSAEGEDASGAEQAAGSFARGVANAGTLGFYDELGAIADTIGGGTYAANLDRRRGQELYDEQNSPWSRIGGQVFGGSILPSEAVNAGRAAALGSARGGAGRAAALVAGARATGLQAGREGAIYGGIYGAGDAEGDLADRLLGGATGAGVGGVTAGALSYGGARAGNRLLERARLARGVEPTEGQATLAAFERQGATPFPADVGGNVTRLATGATAQTFGGVGPIRRAAQATLDSSQAIRDRVANAIGTPVGIEEAGETARAGANQWIADTGARIGRIYDRAGRAAGQATVEAPEAVRVLNAELAPLEEAAVPSPAIGILQGMRDALSQPITVRGLRATRSNIRSAFENAGLRGSNEERIANRVVDAATDDLVNGLRNQGHTDAARDYRVADRLWRARLENIDENLTPILGAATGPQAKSGEQIVQALTAATSGNNRRFASFIGSLPAEEQGVVRASLITRLGQAAAGAQDQTGEVFSLGSFLTHYNKIGPRARASLFGEEGRAALDDLAIIASGAKQAQRFSNFSNTGAAATTGALGASAAFGPLGLLTAGKILAGQYGAGRLLASPRFARWLGRPPRNATPEAVNAYIRRLSRIARSEPAIANDVLSLQQRLSDAFSAAPARLAAQEGPNRSAPVNGEGGNDQRQ